MTGLTILDISIIVLFLLFNILFPLLFIKRKETVKDHFQAGGKLGWFVSGTAMVATTFAADTPLAVTELVAKYGIAGNWLWWYGSVSAIVTVFFFAPLWKKSGVLTDVELVELRYSGIGAKILRMFKSVYLGFFMNVLIMAWVNLAMLKISEVLLPNSNPIYIVSGLFLVALFYTSLAGLTGISFMDAFQFFFAMSGCIVLAYFVLSLPEVGGVIGLQEKIPPAYFHFVPDFKAPVSADFTIESFLVFILVISWASWYPGAEPGGGGYIAQRILASKDLKSSILSSLWFTIAHYFIRPWPWILVALASIVLFPGLSADDKGKGYVLVMQKTLPEGLLGMMVSVFMAAYLSTIATHLNWGSSYLINDLYKPYIKKDKSEAHYLRVTKLIELVLMCASLIISFNYMKSISGVWAFLLECGAGVGFVLILRWYIPRLNAWSELTAFTIPGVFYTIGKYVLELKSPISVLFTVGCVVLSVLLVTAFTPGVETGKLTEFYTKINPPGIFWKRWALKNNITYKEFEIPLKRSLLLSVLGIVLIFSGLFSLGNFLLGYEAELVWSVSILALSSVSLYLLFPET